MYMLILGGCFKCGEDGHIARNCPSAENRQGGGRGGGGGRLYKIVAIIKTRYTLRFNVSKKSSKVLPPNTNDFYLQVQGFNEVISIRSQIDVM